VLPRQDRDNRRGRHLNEKIESYCEKRNSRQIKFVNFSSSFVSKSRECYRYHATRDTDKPDKVHLSNYGVSRLQEVIKVQIQKSLIDINTLKLRGSKLTEDEWINRRMNRYKMREPTRFKITNYKPASEAYEKHIKSLQNDDIKNEDSGDKFYEKDLIEDENHEKLQLWEIRMDKLEREHELQVE
jgi:hypothetical protein